MNVVIRKLDMDDLVPLHAIAKKTFFDTFQQQNSPENMQVYLDSELTLDKIKQEVDTQGSYFYGIEENNALVAYLKINTNEAQGKQSLDNSIEIQRIYIVESHIGKGLGKALFNFAVKQAKLFEARWLWLGVWEYNQHAITFYKKQGLTIYDQYPFYFGQDKQTDLLMRVELDSMQA